MEDQLQRARRRGDHMLELEAEILKLNQRINELTLVSLPHLFFHFLNLISIAVSGKRCQRQKIRGFICGKRRTAGTGEIGGSRRVRVEIGQ